MPTLFEWEESLRLPSPPRVPTPPHPLTYTEALSKVHDGTLTRSKARAWLDAAAPAVTPSERYSARIVRAFAESQPAKRACIHPHRLAIRARELAASQGESALDNCLEAWSLGPLASSHYDRLDRAFGTSCPPLKRKRCEYCRVNDVCMVRCCALTPVGTSTVDSTARFRCLPGMHLCNAHGLQLLANRQTVATDNAVALKDGRFARNAFEGLVTKQLKSREPDAARRKRRLSKDVALVRAAFDARRSALRLGCVDATTALNRLMDDNAPPTLDPPELHLPLF